MWLQRIISDVQTRIFGTERGVVEEEQTSVHIERPHVPERDRAFRERLLALDRRLAQLNERA